MCRSCSMPWFYIACNNGANKICHNQQVTRTWQFHIRACSQFTSSEAQVCWCIPALLPGGQAKGSRDHSLFLGQFLSLLLVMLARKAEQVLGAQQNYSSVDIRVSYLAGGPFIELYWGAVPRKLEHAFWGVLSACKLMGLFIWSKYKFPR